MARHRGYTFRAGTLGRFIKKHGITFDYLQVPPELICRRLEHPGEKHFILTLRKRGSGGLMKLPFTQGADVKEWPELEETLEILIMDVLMYYQYPTPREFVMSWGADMDDWEQEFNILKALTEKTQEFFGEEAFQELITLGSEGFEMGGDRGWRRQRTCGV